MRGRITRCGTDGSVMSADQVARRMWTLFEPVHAVTYLAAAARPWRDREFAAGLAEVLGPIALACSAEVPALNPVGVPRPEQAGPPGPVR